MRIQNISTVETKAQIVISPQEETDNLVAEEVLWSDPPSKE
jgi:hypothetical protein